MLKFNHKTKIYNKQNAYTLMQLSDLVYQDEDIAEEYLGLMDFDNIKFYEKEDTQAFLVWNYLYAIIAMRGTSSIEDIKTDMKIHKIKKPYGRVHRGFHKGLNCIWKDIMKDISSFRTLPLFFTGHSLGGALAAHAKRRLEFEKNRKSICYTFGEPRGGDKKYALYGDTSTHFRHVNNNDIVTDIPPYIFNYRHGGELIYYRESREIGDDTGWWRKQKNKWEGLVDDVGEKGFDRVKDHFRPEYLMCTQVNA